MRCGAGLVYLCVPECIYEIEAVKLTEPIVLPMPHENGMLAAESLEQILPMLTDMDALLIGPGLGRSSAVETVVTELVRLFKGPVILDADGINLMIRHKDILRGRTGITILTPHEGEFARFTGGIPEDRPAAAMQLARDVSSIVVLKGHHTVITDGLRCFTNPTGNPGMAVGGCGDVLAGVITALVGQGVDPLMSAVCGAWIHGAAGDICAEEIGQYGMLPSDMLQVLPRLLK
jgi:NAD(P)H-hydrate epimerase